MRLLNADSWGGVRGIPPLRGSRPRVILPPRQGLDNTWGHLGYGKLPRLAGCLGHAHGDPTSQSSLPWTFGWC